MAVTVITPPEPVVSLEEAKMHIRVDGGDLEDGLIESYVASATQWLDGPAGWLGRSIGVQLLEARGWLSCERLRLEFPPVLEIEDITIEGPGGVREAVDPSTYRLDGDILVVASGAAWVTQPDHRIRYWAGYGHRDPGEASKWINEPPAPIKVAILMLASQWYYNRDAVAESLTPQAMPFGVEALLNPYRIYR
ncbi:head-tail connector protein [Shinella sp. BYT-45]|uniref:head-tail connector protein n=1 Tax=Shinella sp. BYT-45 TaxID=3377377 RepID=UPI003980F4BE